MKKIKKEIKSGAFFYFSKNIELYKFPLGNKAIIIKAKMTSNI